MAPTARIVLFGVVFGAGFFLLLSTDYPSLVQAAVVVAMAIAGSRILYRPHREATKFLSLATALLVTTATTLATGWGPAWFAVLLVATLVAIVLGKRHERRSAQAMAAREQ